MTFEIPRTPEELAAAVERIKHLPLEQQLDVALTLVKDLQALTEKVFGEAVLPPLNLAGLTLEEKLAMGAQQATSLKKLALNATELQALEALDGSDLSGEFADPAHSETLELLARLQQSPTA